MSPSCCFATCPVFFFSYKGLTDICAFLFLNYLLHFQTKERLCFLSIWHVVSKNWNDLKGFVKWLKFKSNWDISICITHCSKHQLTTTKDSEEMQNKMSLFTAIFIKDPTCAPFLKFLIEDYLSAVFWNMSFKSSENRHINPLFTSSRKKKTLSQRALTILTAEGHVKTAGLFLCVESWLVVGHSVGLYILLNLSVVWT